MLTSRARKDVLYPDGLADMKPVVANASSFNMVLDGTQAFLPDRNRTVFESINQKLVEGHISAQEFIDQIKQGTVYYWKNQ